MAVYQTNTWGCEVCGEIHRDEKETSPFDDPVVQPPDGWHWVFYYSEWIMACPGCAGKFSDNSKAKMKE